MKPFLIATALVVAVTVTLRAADVQPSKPNIVFILADDLGIGSVSCYGADNFKTPNLDRLAASGTRFEHCYSAPLCGPARALLMTGRYAFRTGMTENDTGDRLKPGKEIMMPTMMKPAGYVTAMCGKWSQMPLEPSDWGFDEYLRMEGGGKYWNTQRGNKTYTLNGKNVALRNGEYLPDRMHEFVVDFITRHKDQPFYVYYAMSHVHIPILRTPDTVPGTTDQIALYRDNVAYMDKLVGKLIATLDELKLSDNTIIAFAGDNGTSPHFYRYATIHGKPLSGCKYTMLEAGALVPCIVKWPGKIPAGKVTQEMINTCDFYPTLGRLGGAQMPAGVMLDGQDFSSQLIGQSDQWPRSWIYVQLGHWWYDRDMEWKLNQNKELIDMRQAPFLETLVPPDSTDPKAISERKKLQTVLDQLNPAGGILDPKPEAVRAARNVTVLSLAGPTHANPNGVQEHPLTGSGGGSHKKRGVPGNENEPSE